MISVPFTSRFRFEAQVKRLSRFWSQKQIKRLLIVSVHGFHHSRLIRITSHGVNVREQLSAVGHPFEAKPLRESKHLACGRFARVVPDQIIDRQFRCEVAGERIELLTKISGECDMTLRAIETDVGRNAFAMATVVLRNHRSDRRVANGFWIRPRFSL